MKPLTRAQFDAVLSIDARNDALDYAIYSHNFFYSDAPKNRFYFINSELLFAKNPAFTDENLEKFLKHLQYEDEEYDGEPFLEFNPALVYDMLEKKIGKFGYKIPDDLLNYSDDSYYKQTLQT